MKLSRFSLALCLAGTIGLSVPARQGQCHGGLDNLPRPTEKSGSPSYQAAQHYDYYDCFSVGCHTGYGDILPDFSADETNIREEGLPPEPVNVDADLPGDDPTTRDIPANTAKVQHSSSPDDGFTRGDASPQPTPPRGYFSPGYPHPGYMHPNYGYSHTEIDAARQSALAAINDSADLTEQDVTAEAALEEALVENAVTKTPEPQFNKVAKSVLVEALEEEGFGEDTLASEVIADESLEEEPVAKTAAEDLSQEYARYDDTYGYDSEWYGPYDATKVVPRPVAEEQAAVDPETATSLPADYSLTSQYEDRVQDYEAYIQEVDPAPAIEDDSDSIVDYGPAELEVDATTAVYPALDDEDAAFEAAIADEHDEWFYRETYGYGPRYDYDLYGCEDFSAEQVVEQKSSESLPGIAENIEDASQTFPWDYVYRLELGELDADTESTSASVHIPYAPYDPSNDDLNYLAAEDAEAEKDDPAIPASSDFDPAALISEAGEHISQINGNRVLSELSWLTRTLTPMELARRALAVTPIAERGHITVLIPQPKVVEIQPFEPAVDAEVTLRELALFLDDAGRALQNLSRRLEAFADSTSPTNAAGDVTPLQSRNPADLETR